MPAPAAAAPPTSAPLPPAADPAIDNLTASFTALAEQIPGEVGVSITDGQRTSSFGTWDTGPAWSTIKVPLAIAAVRHDPTTSAPLIERAITASDNAAADQLWASLGDPTAAVAAVHQILVDGANPDIQVQAEQIRPPYSPYGQTIWPQTDAARFAWTLPCIPDAGPVLTQMRNITPDQQWGLAALDNTASKGGWGPGPDGNYLARQIGLYHTETGTLGVAIATAPDDGTFTTATSILNNLANWITQNTAELPGAGSCTNS
ncbi:hypothetical protein ACNQVK_02710 [Mycobacterium sp. 134]|uniref:hypothetical protein n=1 Tax=Mycobacterium sp. 134 TaxID=3400425 RepID=UPI003AAFE4FC